jgi:hypothetical protein
LNWKAAGLSLLDNSKWIQGNSSKFTPEGMQIH